MKQHQEINIGRRYTTIRLLGGALSALTACLPACSVIQHHAQNTQDSKGKLLTMDTHAHIFTRDLKLANARRYAPQYDATLDLYLTTLAAHGIGRGILVQPSFLGTDNSFLLDALRQHPDRLRGVAVVNPTLPLAELKQLAQSGIVGLRLNLVGMKLPDFSAAPWPDFFRNAARAELHIEIHREATDLPYILPPLLQSGVTIVLDHFGRPDPLLGINDPGFIAMLKAAESHRIWVKLSGAYRNGANGVGEKIALDAIPLLRNSMGLERLVWGSDWPHTQFENSMTYDKALAMLTIWLPDPAERQQVLEVSPARLAGLRVE